MMGPGCPGQLAGGEQFGEDAGACQRVGWWPDMTTGRSVGRAKKFAVRGAGGADTGLREGRLPRRQGPD
jgi:hypothetical protein